MVSRKVDFSILHSLIKKRPILSMFGLLFTIPLLFLLIPFLILTSNINKNSTSANYEVLLKEGLQTKGILKNFETVYEVSINNEHPIIITYTFLKEKETKIDSYQTFVPNKVKKLSKGQEIEIKYSEKGSVVVGFPPYTFPTYLIGLIFIIFPLIGLPFLIILIIKTTKEFYLYKKGTLTSGIIFSISDNLGLMFTKFGHSVTVTYKYKDTQGNLYYGKSRSVDLSEIKKMEKGDKINILISPKTPSESTIWSEDIAKKMK
ncbi:hypothetical protein [Aquimarina pacifica]|uniref:hypothetical protein n=1 Tax=Aquimarina pacifica TaxID=1296415 RepID=UPI000470E73C|nr:hypothetical protein [Aquimarina pacifica]